MCVWKNNFLLHYIFPPFSNFSFILYVCVCVIGKFNIHFIHFPIVFEERPCLAFSISVLNDTRVKEEKWMKVAAWTLPIYITKYTPTLWDVPKHTAYSAWYNFSLQQQQKTPYKKRTKFFLLVENPSSSFACFFYTKWRGFESNENMHLLFIFQFSNFRRLVLRNETLKNHPSYFCITNIKIIRKSNTISIAVENSSFGWSELIFLRRIH